MVDEDIVVDKLRLIDQYVEELHEMREIERSEYVSNVVLQRAVERTLMNCIQACIDVAAHIRKSEDVGPARTSREQFEALADVDILTDQTRDTMEEATGFRNVLAHRYGDIDHEIVYDVLHEDLQYFEDFQREIAQWLQANRANSENVGPAGPE